VNTVAISNGLPGRSIAGHAAAWAEAFLGFFYGDVCEGCHKQRATAKEGYVCAACRDNVKPIEPPFCRRCGAVFAGEITSAFECGNCRDLKLDFSQARAVASAEGVLLDVLHRYKYENGLWVAPFLTELFAEVAGPQVNAGGWDLIVPVPLHPRRQKEREFNQARVLAGALSKATQIELNPRLLRRVIDTRTQTRLSRAERLKNVKGAFQFLGSKADVRGKRIVLVDDVLTTGATANGCARLLRQNGAAEVCVWTLARSRLH
jgi:competence protein ComFC